MNADSSPQCRRCGADVADPAYLCTECTRELTGNWREETPAQRVYSRFHDWRVLLYAELDRLPADYRRTLAGDLRQTLERLEATPNDAI